MFSHDLVDIWRERNPFDKNFTWSSNVTPGIHCRLDYFLISRHASPAVTDNVFSPGFLSDHSFVCLSIGTQEACRGPGFWKSNNSLLNDSKYICLIHELICNQQKENASYDPVFRWELLKFNIRKTSMKFAKERAKEMRLKEKKLIQKIADLEQQFYVNRSPVIHTQLREAQNDLLLYYEYKLKGTMIRSRARWVEDGEKNSKYFFNLEKRNKALNSILKLEKSNGIFLTERNGILEEIRNFYKTLYTSKGCNPESFFDGLPDQNIADIDLESCEGELTLDECYQALVSMKNDKAPGSDGLSVNFYKTFWNSIGQVVLESLNFGYQRGQLSTEQTRGIVTLILKGNKAATSLQNYRPITLLNTDYKIAAKVIASRLKGVIHSLIGPHQTGFLKGFGIR
ncbi:hypothetical protein HOLleu_06338 [Holothuria leucospilota]|uniref:Uncharacterized protein n=1 Tax=Holothuria leucospilota TaxID=206669 RepID=A0A9Q1CKS3_HOLLE|nr:hypothetical protein HOLleu_06338 [Holothuria leucospilota]